MTLFLYISTVLIWGSTWIAIYFQLNQTDIIVSVFLRFALAAMIMMPIMLLTKKIQKTNLTDHKYLALQGLCLFSCNFICFYNATLYIPSGLVSVIFSLATLYNAVNNHLFWKEPITQKVIIASILGFIGLSILFYPELSKSELNLDTLKGIAFGALGTLFFSFGNMISKRHSNNGIKPQTTIAYALFYGSAILITVILLTGKSFSVDATPVYLSSLVYLSVVGTILGFTAYLSLVARIGPNHAAYTTVLFPIVALFFSGLYEGYEWSILSFVGLAFVIVGNITLNKKP